MPENGLRRHEAGVLRDCEIMEVKRGNVGPASYGEPEIPASRARTIASARVRTPSLLKMLET
jgi:hypothetical protein